MSKSKRAEVKADISARMIQKGLDSAVYESQLTQYMEWYDQLAALNKKAQELGARPDSERLYIACLGEARQVQKAMQGILDWLGVNPETDSAKENYDL